MSILEKVWHLYVGESWIGSLTPTGADDDWYYADFDEGDAWGNFKPWFVKAVEAQQTGDDAAWQETYEQLNFMGMALVSDDDEVYESPTIFIDGGSAWFFV